MDCAELAVLLANGGGQPRQSSGRNRKLRGSSAHRHPVGRLVLATKGQNDDK